MRLAFTVCLLCLTPLTAAAQGKKKKSRKLPPIKVVELKRSEPIVYEKDIEPIFYRRCISCHSGNVVESLFDISSYDKLMKGGSRGKAILPGKSDDSLLYKLMGRTGKPYMPPRGEKESTPEELALVKLWIDQGAKAPTGGPRVVDLAVTLTLPPTNLTPVRAVAVSPDKSTVVSSRGNQLHVYDAGSGKHVRILKDPKLRVKVGDKLQPVDAAHISFVESMAFSPDGKYLATGSFQELSIWDPYTGMMRHKITGFDHNIVAIRFSPDGKKMAIGGGYPTKDGEIKVFEVGSWKQLTDIKNAHSDTVYGVAFNPDGTKLATCSADKFIKTWDLPSGKFIKSFEGHTHHVLGVGWQKGDGKYLASAGADNTVKIWDFEKGEQTRTINNAHTKQVTSIQFIGKTTQVVTCSGDTRIRFFNVTNGGAVRNFAGNSDFVYAVDVSPDGQMVAAGGEEGVVRVYNGANGQLLRSLLPPSAQPKEKKKK